MKEKKTAFEAGCGGDNQWLLRSWNTRVGAFRAKFGAVCSRSDQSGPMLIPGMNWLPYCPHALLSAPPQVKRQHLACPSGDTIKECFLHFLLCRGPKDLLLLPVLEKNPDVFSHIYSDQFFSLSQFCLPLKTCSSSDFDAVGDVKTALKRHRWADDDDKERSD